MQINPNSDNLAHKNQNRVVTENNTTHIYHVAMNRILHQPSSQGHGKDADYQRNLKHTEEIKSTSKIGPGFINAANPTTHHHARRLNATLIS